MTTAASGPGVRRLVREAALAEARALARRGRYSEALDLLDGAEDASLAVLDLKARVYAQQGRLDDADRCWARVEELAPGDADAAEGRRRIAALRARTVSPGRVLAARTVLRAGAALVALLALAMLVDLWLDRGDDDRRPAAVARPAASAEPSAAPSASPSASPSADPLAEMRLDGPGVRADRRTGEIAVTFQHGLFRSGASLTRSGKAALDGLAERLKPYGDRVEIAVVGHTDRTSVQPGGGYASNAELGLLRAAVVREVLSDAAGIPAARFSISTLAGELPPYRGGGAGDGAGDPRNRTVDLRVSAYGGPGTGGR